MLQKCSNIKVLEIFFREPTKVHFIREISRSISLAATSVKNHAKQLENEGLIAKIEHKPFTGYVAQRDDDIFRQYKQIYNLYSLIELKTKLINSLGPKAIVLFGSYQKGEDIENSDIDLAVLSKVKKEMDLREFEKVLGRNIHLTFISDIGKIEKNIQVNIKNGWVIYGKV